MREGSCKMHVRCNPNSIVHPLWGFMKRKLCTNSSEESSNSCNTEKQALTTSKAGLVCQRWVLEGCWGQERGKASIPSIQAQTAPNRPQGKKNPSAPPTVTVAEWAGGWLGFGLQTGLSSPRSWSQREPTCARSWPFYKVTIGRTS